VQQPTFEHAPVILISIDTLRADHLPLYGYAQGATPNIDALRADGILVLARVLALSDDAAVTRVDAHRTAADGT
jgi:hypothetical protein